jgi:hypothetical protein
MSEIYEALLNAKTNDTVQRLLAEFTKDHWIDAVYNGHTLLSAALLVQKTHLVPLLMERGSDPRFVNRIKMNSLQTILFHGDELLGVLKLLFEKSLYYIELSIIFSDCFKRRQNSQYCRLCCAYIEAVRAEQENPTPVMNRLGALLAPRQYALSLAEEKREQLAEEVRQVFSDCRHLRLVFFHPSSTASRLPQVIGRHAAAFLAPSAAELAVLRHFF